MDLNLLEKILNLFDKFQLNGKSLEINIDQDLLKILPLPRKLIIDLLNDDIISKIFYLSEDQNTVHFSNNLRLCLIDQNKGGSCKSSSCEQLHICKDYILNTHCLQLNTYGRCSHSHSLLTTHNQFILEKYNLLENDEQTFQFISYLIQISLSITNPSRLFLQTNNQQSITEDLIDLWLNDHKSLLIHKRFINQYTIQLIFGDDEDDLSLNDSNINKNNFISHSNNNQQVQLTNRTISPTCDKRLENNDENKYRDQNRIGLIFGRSRGRNQLNNVPPPPSLSNQQLSSIDSSITNKRKFKFSSRLNSTKETDFYSQEIKSKNNENKINSTSEIDNNQNNFISNQFDHHQQSQDINLSSTSYSPNLEHNQDEIHDNNKSPLIDDPNEIDSCENASSISTDVISKTHFVLRRHSTRNKDKSPVTTTMNYFYTKQFNDQHLCYLLGPGRKNITENDQCQILSCLPSGYCRLTNIEQGKDIEKRLYSILPNTLNIETVKIDTHLSLIICSSAAEYIFQENQIHYAIITEPLKVYLNIDVIHEKRTEQRKSSPTLSENKKSSSTDDEHCQQLSSDGKFHISATDSSIDVISGDITQIPVDMMICVSTSNNLRDSVLRRAGHKIESQYKERYHPTDALLLDGGLTAARKILFVPWQTEIEEAEIIKTQKSLSDLVKWCIEQGYQRNMKSISFPPIGAGQLGLDPVFVSETMINAVNQCLKQYKIDVLFVIYPSSGINPNHQHDDDDECYQIFRIYLDSLCDQIEPKKVSTPTIDNQTNLSTNFETQKQIIRRDIQSKRVLTLSNSSNIIEHHNLLIKSLENLLYEKSLDLSLIESSLIDKIDLLIDICLKYNVIPCIDYSKNELKLIGDHDSCFQCFFNLCQNKKVYQYSYVLTQDGEKIDEIKLNSFISLKIDEAFVVKESNIYIEDDKIMFNIDLNKLQVKINQTNQLAFLVKKEINSDSKLKLPSSWSSSLFMIRTIEINKSAYEGLECFRIFHETMSTNDWIIEQIYSIENYPLYLHFMNNNNNCETKLYYHGCPYSSVQSIIHYGLHSSNASNYGCDQFENRSIGSICLTRDILNSHLYGTRRSTDGKHYLFVVELAKYDLKNDFILLTNNDTYLALPTYLIVYQRRNNFD
ncbi:unnamed protein product [Rotaria sp. Silwood1]|nr:unnamed protein product [Rotaria sp. Silwood1]CAF1253339.1 unnamed protein product [Rotaria sp. Silwood1]